MPRFSLPACLLVFVYGVPSALAAEDGALRLEDALALARERAPAILAARARVEEAKGRSRTAEVSLKENPMFEGDAGPREGADGRTTDLNLSISQSFELGGRRGARIEAGGAALDRDTALADEAIRRALRDTAIAFMRGLAAQEKVRLQQESASTADALQRSAERRYEAGDIAAFELNLARAAAARAGAATLAAEADLEAKLGALRALLGIGAEEPLRLAGGLGDDGVCSEAPPVQSLDERTDIRALKSELRQAEAEKKFASGLKWPDLTARLGYERERDDDIYLGGIGIHLPVFDSGAGTRAEASARASRVEMEMAAARRNADVEVRTALDVCRRWVAAANRLEQGALGALADNDDLAKRSYDEGQIGLIDLLLFRRESVEIRAEHLGLLLEASLAGIEYRFSAGVLR